MAPVAGVNIAPTIRRFRLQLQLLSLAVCVISAGCVEPIIRSFGPVPVEARAQPSAQAELEVLAGAYATCPGEPVIMSWSLEPETRRAFCACWNGAPWTPLRVEPISCSTTAACGTGARCLDGLCCDLSCGSQCGQPGSECVGRIDARFEAPGWPHIPVTSVAGQVEVRPVVDTAFTLSGNITSWDGEGFAIPLIEQTVFIDVLRIDETAEYVLGFDWECPNCSWLPGTLPDRDETLVEIVAVRNTGPFNPVMVGVNRRLPAAPASPTDVVGPVTVGRTAEIEAFNGPFRGAWTVGVTGDARVACLGEAAGRGSCRPTSDLVPPPSLPTYLNFTYRCIAERASAPGGGGGTDQGNGSDESKSNGLTLQSRAKARPFRQP